MAAKLIYRTTLFCVILAATVSCSEDEMFREKLQGTDDAMTFGVSFSDEWQTVPEARSTEDPTACATRLGDSDYWLSVTSEPNTENPFLASKSRGTAVTTDNFSALYGSFGVYGFATDNETGEAKMLLNAEKAILSANGNWITDPVRYWPEAGYTMDFYAYAPYKDENLSIYIENGLPLLNYDVSDNVKEQKDIVFATRQSITNLSEDYKKNVNLFFKHILTKINVKAARGLTGKITKVALKNIINSGTYTPGRFAQWNIGSTAKNYVIDTDVELDPDLENGTPIIYDDDSFFMIPQYVGDSELEVTMIEDGKESIVSGKLSSSWEAGKTVTYQIYESFFSAIVYYINGIDGALEAINYQQVDAPEKNRPVSRSIAGIRIEKWSLSPSVDELVDYVTFYNNKNELETFQGVTAITKRVYINGFFIEFQANAPSDTTVSGVPRGIGQFGKGTQFSIILPSQIPSCDGYVFEGWAESQDASEAQYRPGDAVTLDVYLNADRLREKDKLDLYAVWKKL